MPDSEERKRESITVNDALEAALAAARPVLEAGGVGAEPQEVLLGAMWRKMFEESRARERAELPEKKRAKLERRDEFDLEHSRIDWGAPNAGNGWNDRGRVGSAWWAQERERGTTEIVASRLTSEKVPWFWEPPRRNPLPDYLSAEEWAEVRRRVRAAHRKRAEDLLELGYRYARFLEGKDLSTAQRNAEPEMLEEYAAAARDAATIFRGFAAGLEGARDARR